MWQQNSQNCWPYPLPSYHSQVWREFFIKHCMLSAPRPQSSHDPWLSSQCLYTQWSGSLVCSQNPQPYVTLHMPDMPDGFSKTRLLTLQHICAFCISGFPALKILSLISFHFQTHPLSWRPSTSFWNTCLSSFMQSRVSWCGVFDPAVEK